MSAKLSLFSDVEKSNPADTFGMEELMEEYAAWMDTSMDTKRVSMDDRTGANFKTNGDNMADLFGRMRLDLEELGLSAEEWLEK